MGYSGYSQPNPPCANCSKPQGGYMVSSEWGHNQPCCSHACGNRLSQKIRNGMLPNEEYSRELALRIEIKILSARIKSLEAALTTPERG